MNKTSSVTLTVWDIGRSDPDATVRSEHADVNSAYDSLVSQFGSEQLRGGINGGTVGSMTGRVFQASRVWSIR